MVRLAISVEGPTEERFVISVLAPYLLARGIFMQPISLGGNVSVDRIKHEIGKLIYSFDYVTTLYDFYGFRKKAADETKESLEKKIAVGLNHQLSHRFIPYIQMYEFEALLFTSPEAIGAVFNRDDLVGWAQDILSQFNGNPEAINDSVQTAPSKRFEQHTPYRKTTHGPDIARAIGIDKIRQCCAGFDDWLNCLEGLAKS
ncbi:MAG: hypothetical protein ACI8WB_001153 [Phenylobacterium sp.]|jgi:hypothetical protein